jgi:hypothetical protein
MAYSKDNDTRMQDAVAGGDSLEMLKVMRTQLAERFDIAAPRDTASIARQLDRVIGLIAELESGTSVTDDKIAAFFAAEWQPE